jgi:hypothetical protein
MAASPQEYRPVALRAPRRGCLILVSAGRHPIHRIGIAAVTRRSAAFVKLLAALTVTAPLAACGRGPNTLSAALYGGGYPQYAFASGYPGGYRAGATVWRRTAVLGTLVSWPRNN